MSVEQSEQIVEFDTTLEFFEEDFSFSRVAVAPEAAVAVMREDFVKPRVSFLDHPGLADACRAVEYDNRHLEPSGLTTFLCS